MAPAPSVFDYLDHRAFLGAWFSHRKQQEGGFSHRRFARMAGQSSPSLALEVMEGNRNLTPATADGFCRAMELSNREADFFLALVRLNQAKDPQTRNRAWARVAACREHSEGRASAVASVAYLSTWYLPAVRELSNRPGFSADPKWIAAQLRPRITPAQASKAVETLLAIGLLTDEGGALVASDAPVAPPGSLRDMAADNYHRTMTRQALAAVDTEPEGRRHYCGLTLGVPAAALPAIRQELDRCQIRVLQAAEQAGDAAEEVVQVNLQMFPMATPGCR